MACFGFALRRVRARSGRGEPGSVQLGPGAEAIAAPGRTVPIRAQQARDEISGAKQLPYRQASTVSTQHSRR